MAGFRVVGFLVGLVVDMYYYCEAKPRYADPSVLFFARLNLAMLTPRCFFCEAEPRYADPSVGDEGRIEEKREGGAAL